MLIPWLCLARLLQLSLFIHSVPQSLSHPFIHPISVGRAPTRTSKGLVSADLFPSRSAPQLSVPVLRPRRLTAGALLPSAFRLETLAGNLKRKQLGNSACSASPPRWSVVGGPSSFQQLSSLWTQPPPPTPFPRGRDDAPWGPHHTLWILFTLDVVSLVNSLQFNPFESAAHWDSEEGRQGLIPYILVTNCRNTRATGTPKKIR